MSHFAPVCETFNLQPAKKVLILHLKYHPGIPFVHPLSSSSHYLFSRMVGGMKVPIRGDCVVCEHRAKMLRFASPQGRKKIHGSWAILDGSDKPYAPGILPCYPAARPSCCPRPPARSHPPFHLRLQLVAARRPFLPHRPFRGPSAEQTSSCACRTEWGP